MRLKFISAAAAEAVRAMADVRHSARYFMESPLGLTPREVPRTRDIRMTVLIQFCELAIGALPRGRGTARYLRDTIAGRKSAETSHRLTTRVPIGLGRKAGDISSKLIPMRLVTLKYDNLDLQSAVIVHSAKRKCQMIW
jgi:hypothetical protein